MRRISTGIQGRSILGSFVAETNRFTTREVNQDLVLEPDGTGIVRSASDFKIDGTNGSLILETNDGNEVKLQTASGVGYTLTMPTSAPSAGEVLISNASGDLTFDDINLPVSNQTADTATYYPLMSTSSSGGITGVTTTTGKLEFQPSSGTLSATKIVSTFEGDLTGTADSASSLIESNEYRVDSLGVGTDASGTTGEIRATNNITSFYSSDIALKENVQDISNPLEIVNNIRGKVFSWRDEYIQQRGGEDGYFVQKRDFGVIAQDVQNSFPLAVREKQDNTLAVDYTKLAAVAFAAISELDNKVEKLKEMFDASDNR